jgi:hypothetical protein
MFRVVLSPIIRSTYYCIYSNWCLSHRYCYLPLSWKSWNRFECAVGGVRRPQHTQPGSTNFADRRWPLCLSRTKAMEFSLACLCTKSYPLLNFVLRLSYIYIGPQIPYFSIYNAHIMYNAQPKLFRHSFRCTNNAHDAN